MSSFVVVNGIGVAHQAGGVPIVARIGIAAIVTARGQRRRRQSDFEFAIIHGAMSIFHLLLLPMPLLLRL